MVVERTDKEIIIRLPATMDEKDLEGFLKYARYKELTSKFKVSQKQVDTLVAEVKKGWWAANKSKFIKDTSLSK